MEKAQGQPEDTERKAESSASIPPYAPAPSPANPGLDTAEQLALDQPSSKPEVPMQRIPVALPSRPPLRRDQSGPPPAPPQAQDAGPLTDSLSVMQLRRLVHEMPRIEPTPYAFEYKDADRFPEELEEWFSYQDDEQERIFRGLRAFTYGWKKSQAGEALDARWADIAAQDPDAVNGHGGEDEEPQWTKESEQCRKRYITSLLSGLLDQDLVTREVRMSVLVYISLGCWFTTAAQGKGKEKASPDGEHPDKDPYTSYASQMEWIVKNVRSIHECGGLPVIYEAMRDCCQRAVDSSVGEADASVSGIPLGKEGFEGLWESLTLLYILTEVSRPDEGKDHIEELRQDLSELQPSLYQYLTEIVARMRWDEATGLPLTKLLLLLWKYLLVSLGGTADVAKVKDAFSDNSVLAPDKHGQPLITASPLDYHLFRQEISSKYPAYNPPPPLFPLEPENNSILPPLKPPSKSGSSAGVSFGAGPANVGHAGSIMHQPVHIATPAPSPPPSPAGPGGKGGKKQNYQTNQLFPFLYPPLDDNSNLLGGKGSTELQDVLVGRKWEGSDIPASILEAVELFANRMRATRAMKQLWQERVRFMKFERGWCGPADDADIEPLELASQLDAAKQAREDLEGVDPLVAAKLQKAEDYYKQSLAHMQSFIIVLLKVILNNVTALITQQTGQNGASSTFQFQELQNGTTAAGKPEPNGNINGVIPDISNTSVEEIEALRNQEIGAKAVSGILILLLKWFKVNHILKFEYVTQLLLDSNYIPLVLKLLQTQELEKAVSYKVERKELNLFRWCQLHSRSPPPPLPTDDSSEIDDDAAPPPIRMHRNDSTTAPDASLAGAPISSLQPPARSMAATAPAVDELGFPTTDLPSSPITVYSWRIFFSSINNLRIMQKICKHKAHRNLLLVQYKSSQFLKRVLKVPQPQLRLYTLKLFKNQVPYCGRKWRQSNMRVITAVYLHCRPELRDDWLAGSDIDAEVEEALPLEQALRALTHWYNVERYPGQVGAEEGVLEKEQDFFVRELMSMDWGGDEVGFGEEAAGVEGPGQAQSQWEGLGDGMSAW